MQVQRIGGRLETGPCAQKVSAFPASVRHCPLWSRGAENVADPSTRLLDVSTKLRGHHKAGDR
jgi:hypothetical protein